MSESFDPWEAASSTRKNSGRRKTVRIAGTGPGKVHTVIRLNDFRGRAVHVFHLLQQKHVRIDKPTDDEWSSYSNAGVAISYPPRDRSLTDTKFWCDYGIEQAKKLGLEVRE